MMERSQETKVNKACQRENCSIEELIQSLRDSSSDVRANSAEQLSRLGDPTALQALEEVTFQEIYLSQENKITRVEVLNAIAEIACAVGHSRGFHNLAVNRALEMLGNELQKPLQWHQIFDPIAALSNVATCGAGAEHEVIRALVRGVLSCHPQNTEAILRTVHDVFFGSEQAQVACSFLDAFYRNAEGIKP